LCVSSYWLNGYIFLSQQTLSTRLLYILSQLLCKFFKSKLYIFHVLPWLKSIEAGSYSL